MYQYFIKCRIIIKLFSINFDNFSNKFSYYIKYSHVLFKDLIFYNKIVIIYKKIFVK